jgi:hypothetical protein
MYPYRRLKLRKRPFRHRGRRRIFPLSWYFNTTHSNFATSQQHHHDTHTLSLLPPTQPAATMADDTITGNGSSSSNNNSGSNNISNNSSNDDRLLPNGDHLVLYRLLQAEQTKLQAAERKRRIDELVEKHSAANTLVGIAALFDSINADADLYYPGVRPRELDDPRWPTPEELWVAVATTPPPATIADVLALRNQTPAPAPAPTPTAAPTVVRPIERDVLVPAIARRKKAAPSRKPQGQLERGEPDPSEPRYCVCDDISWGTMVGCDNRSTCEKWFHLSCIGLDELPPRGTKWYCPDCRKKLKLGMQTNGLVERPMPPPPPPRVATSSSTGRLRVPPTVVAPTTVGPTDREVRPGETRPAKRRRRKQQ